MPPAETPDTEGLIEKPRVTPIVTTAVLEVIVDELLLELVVVLDASTCCATAVMSTWPLFVEGTIAGAV